MYLSRKSFAFNSDRPGAGGEANRDVFTAAMKTVDVTFQNLDSSEISLTDVSHYFDSDPTKLVQGLRADGRAPAAFIADTTTANAQVWCGAVWGAGAAGGTGAAWGRASACAWMPELAVAAAPVPSSPHHTHTHAPPTRWPLHRCARWARRCAWTPAPSCSTPSGTRACLGLGTRGCARSRSASPTPWAGRPPRAW